MEPAVKDGQWYFVNHISPYFKNYAHDEIIVFKHEEKAWVSRVVALAGDTLLITDGNLIINGIPAQDKVQRNWEHWEQGAYAINKSLRIPADHVFVLSDNLSANHDDSRVFGPIAKKNILGVVW